MLTDFLRKKGLFIVILLIILTVFVFVKIWMLDKQPVQEPNPSVTTPTSTPSKTPGTKIYKNTEFGFEFEYSKDWPLRTDVFYSRYSPFNLAGGPLGKEFLFYAPLPPFFVSVVTPEFVDHAYYITKNSAVETKVGGVAGLEYKYKTEWVSNTTIILPLREYRIILGAIKEYENDFNKILASFHFLKNTSQIPNSSKIKIYSNKDWGFEFQYPEELWIFRINTFSSPFSKFHLIGAPLSEEGLIYAPNTPFIINIVTLDFADNFVRNMEVSKASESDIVVAGLKGKKYEYEENVSEIGIDIPFGQYHMILGATKEYEDVFNQILASFKFLK